MKLSKELKIKIANIVNKTRREYIAQEIIKLLENE